jgi:hypothetical protein
VIFRAVADPHEAVLERERRRGGPTAAPDLPKDVRDVAIRRRDRDRQFGRDLAGGATAGQSRIWAGIHFPTDVRLGLALGSGVAEKVIERARGDDALQS